MFLVTDRPDAVFELDNDNNVLGSAAFQVTLEPPDLVVSSIGLPENSVRAGNSLSVQWTVTNEGIGDTLTGSWLDSVYASFDDQIGDDVLLGSLAHAGRLDPDQSYDRFGTFTIPFSFGGPIWVYVTTDRANQVAEFTGEANNTSALVPLSVVRETADLAASPLNLAAESGRVRLGWSVQNTGVNTTNSTNWRDAVYLSPNEIFGDSDDLRLTSVYRGQRLVAGQSYTVNQVFEIPSQINQLVNFFVITDEENRVDEDGIEANNVALLGQLDTSTLRTVPDLVVQNVDAPLDAISGQFFEVTWTVRNRGDAIEATGTPPPEYADGQWNDAVYLSADQVFDPGADLYLGSATIDRRQLTEMTDQDGTFQEYIVTRNYQIPSGVTGPLYVLVVADRNNHVIEIGGEDNNQGLDPQSLFASLADPADLVLGTVNVPEDATLGGASVSLTYTLENQGTNGVAGRWFDRFYLSTDDQFSVDDVPFGSLYHSYTTIAPGQSQAFDTNQSIGAVLPGDYFVIVRTDVFNAIPESDDRNNVGASLDTFNISVPEIVIANGTGSTQIETDIFNSLTRTFYYQFNAQEGQTISLEGHGIEDLVGDLEPRQTVTTAYVARGRVPTPFDFDYRETRLLSTSLNSFVETPLVIPRTEAGAYFIRLDVRDTHPRVYFSNEVRTARSISSLS